MLINREVILAKIETVYGTDSVPVAATDAVLVENIGWSNEGLRMNERPAIRANIGTLQQVFGGTLRGLTFDIELKGGGGAVDVPPEYGPLLRACAIGETIDPAVDVQYAPVSIGHESVTIYYFQDGIRYILTGCVGNVSFSLETGGLGKMSFTMVGHSVTPTDIALPSPTVLTTVPVALINVPFTIGGFSAVINALNFDVGNTVGNVPDMSAVDGYGQIRITKRDVAGSYDPEGEVIATDDPHIDLVNGASLVLTTGVIGSVIGNRYKIDMPAVVYRDLSPGDREGVRVYDIPFGAAESAGDDEFTLTTT